MDTIKQKYNPVLVCVWWVILNPEIPAGGSGPELLIAVWGVCFRSLNQPSSYKTFITTSPPYNKDSLCLRSFINALTVLLLLLSVSENTCECLSSFYGAGGKLELQLNLNLAAGLFSPWMTRNNQGYTYPILVSDTGIDFDKIARSGIGDNRSKPQSRAHYIMLRRTGLSAAACGPLGSAQQQWVTEDRVTFHF